MNVFQEKSRSRRRFLLLVMVLVILVFSIGTGMIASYRRNEFRIREYVIDRGGTAYFDNELIELVDDEHVDDSLARSAWKTFAMPWLPSVEEAYLDGAVSSDLEVLRHASSLRRLTLISRLSPS